MPPWPPPQGRCPLDPTRAYAAPGPRHFQRIFYNAIYIPEFNKLPFGLVHVNSPSTYSRALSLVLRDLSWKSVLAYLDDICVLGKSVHVDDQLTNLKHVLKLKWFRQRGLKHKPTKCDLFQTEILFLGRKVGKEGVAMTSESIKTVQNWSPPTTKEGIERFLGLINYHVSLLKM